MKRKIKVTIHKHASENDFILRAIGNMNEGNIPFSSVDLIGYLKMRKAYLPSANGGYLWRSPDSDILAISEDGGKSLSLTLEWVEVHELSPADEEIEKELQGGNGLAQRETIDDMKDVW